MGRHEVGLSRAGVAFSDPDEFLAKPAGMLLHSALVREQFAVHRQDRVDGQLLRQRDRRLHCADVPNDRL
ncbi:hypothetical protein ACFPRL_09315 [Pseudoclavibacter helvolus]